MTSIDGNSRTCYISAALNRKGCICPSRGLCPNELQDFVRGSLDQSQHVTHIAGRQLPDQWHQRVVHLAQANASVVEVQLHWHMVRSALLYPKCEASQIRNVRKMSENHRKYVYARQSMENRALVYLCKPFQDRHPG